MPVSADGHGIVFGCLAIKLIRPSVGIDLKELGGQMSKGLKFCTGIEILNQFLLKNERL